MVHRANHLVNTATSIFVQLEVASPDPRSHHRFSSRKKFATRCNVVSQVNTFDVSNAVALHREAAETAAQVRRQAIDQSIADFAGAIGNVMKAIKETSDSLTSTSATLEQAADDTLHRMASASSASAETTQRVRMTVAATRRLQFGDQRLAPEMRWLRSKIQTTALQRLLRMSLTVGNVARILTSGT